MRVGYYFCDNEKNISGINRMIRATMDNIIGLSTHNQYYALQENYLRLKINECKYSSVYTVKEYDYCSMGLMPRCDIIHSFYKPFDFLKNDSKKIFTICDMLPLIHPEWFQSNMRSFFDEKIRKSAELSDAIITISNSTKKDIIDIFGIDSKKIYPVYLGVDNRIDYGLKNEDAWIEGIVKSPYILSVCTIEPRKNLRGTIEAFVNYKKDSGSEVKLILCGKQGWDTEFSRYYDGLGKYKDDIIKLGYVDDEQLGTLYRKALAVVYCSFYEGFGLPVLEAMTAGKAVITSNVSSLPEVGGDAVCYCNPYSIESMSSALAKVIEDEKYRKSLGEKAIIQASKFSYEKTAKEILNIYQEVLNQ